MKTGRNITGALGLLLLAVILGVMHGPTPITPATVVTDVFHPNNSIASIIIWQIRMPRVAAAALVGGSLAVAGAVMQALLQNPLADPYIVGASSGAGLGAILAEEWLPNVGAIAPGAFIGALGAVMLSYLISRGRRFNAMLTLILAGYAIGVILTSVSTFLMLLNREELTSIFAWEVGGIHGMTWGPVRWAALLMALALLLIWPMADEMNALLLGEEEAHHLGVPVRQVRFLLLLAASLLTASAVYLSGLIGFVGLVVPHIIRRLQGPNHRTLIPLSFLVGAAFLTLADVIAETMPVVGSIPVGLVTAFLGGPYFLYLLVQQNRGSLALR